MRGRAVTADRPNEEREGQNGRTNAAVICLVCPFVRSLKWRRHLRSLTGATATACTAVSDFPLSPSSRLFRHPKS